MCTSFLHAYYATKDINEQINLSGIKKARPQDTGTQTLSTM